MKLVRESLGFERTGNVKSSLGIGGRIVKINEFFNSLKIPKHEYTIESNGKVIYHDSLELMHTHNIDVLPGNLIIEGYLGISSSSIYKLEDNLTVEVGFVLGSDTGIYELPNNLTVYENLNLSYSNITELPDTLNVYKNIVVRYNQTELIDFIKNSKFKDKVEIW